MANTPEEEKKNTRQSEAGANPADDDSKRAASGRQRPSDSEADEPEAASAEDGGPRQSAGEDGKDVAELSVKEQLEAARSERDAHYDQLLRARAELENYRKRVQRESEEFRLYQALPLIRDLLPAVDNLGRAIQAARDAGNAEELVQGVEMVKKQFEDTLSRYAAVPIEAVGEPFDPNLHEAVQQVPSQEHPPMTVVEELQRGYKLHERVVRPSKVVVSSGPPE